MEPPAPGMGCTGRMMKWQPCQYRPESTANSDNLDDEPEAAEKGETSMPMRDSTIQHDPPRDASHARGRKFETRRAHWSFPLYPSQSPMTQRGLGLS